MSKWSLTRVSNAVFDVHIPFKRNTKFEFWVLYSSDRHHDNPDTDQALEYHHLKQCQSRGGICIDGGDFFCAMQGKYDKRKSKDKVRDEHNNNNYLDSLVDTAAKDFAPYTDVLKIIGRGNHETAITKNHETDLTERLCEKLTQTTGNEVHAAGYHGWVRFNFRDTAGSGSGTARSTKMLHFQHGYGGGGPVTRGVIQTNRRATYLPGADIVASGHIHERWWLEIPRVRVTQAGTIRHDTQLHFSTTSYKDEFQEGQGGFQIERGSPPKPLGAMWLRFTWNHRLNDVDIDVLRAR